MPQHFEDQEVAPVKVAGISILIALPFYLTTMIINGVVIFNAYGGGALAGYVVGYIFIFIFLSVFEPLFNVITPWIGLARLGWWWPIAVVYGLQLLWWIFTGGKGRKRESH
jgi:hypothetical protein